MTGSGRSNPPTWSAIATMDKNAGAGTGRRMAISWRSTRSSTSLVVDVRPISRTNPSIWRKIRYSNRSDTAAIIPERLRAPITAGQRQVPRSGTRQDARCVAHDVGLAYALAVRVNVEAAVVAAEQGRAVLLAEKLGGALDGVVFDRARSITSPGAWRTSGRSVAAAPGDHAGFFLAAKQRSAGVG